MDEAEWFERRPQILGRRRLEEPRLAERVVHSVKSSPPTTTEARARKCETQNSALQSKKSAAARQKKHGDVGEPSQRIDEWTESQAEKARDRGDTRVLWEGVTALTLNVNQGKWLSGAFKAKVQHCSCTNINTTTKCHRNRVHLRHRRKTFRWPKAARGGEGCS